MARQIQIRRGTATQHTKFTGAIGEITMDTTNKTLRVHDGTTAGGIELAKKSEIPTTQSVPSDIMSADYVIEKQLPSSANGYNWYRKYKSGWVEQGGRIEVSNTSGAISATITTPIPTNDSNSLIVTYKYKSGDTAFVASWWRTSNTTFTVQVHPMATNGRIDGWLNWVHHGVQP